MRSLTLASAAVLLVALPLAGCATAPGQSGADVDPFTLTSVLGNSPGTPGADVLAAMVDTGGAVEVTEPFEPTGPVEDGDGNAVTSLANGEADVTVVRADKLVELGAESLAPLQAPGVVVNEEHASVIADDPDLFTALTADVAELDLVAIAIVPGGMRYPFGYLEPLLTLDDWNGAVINARFGTGVEAIVNALGGTIDHSVENRSELASNGGLRGIEVSLQQIVAVDRPAAMTSNLPLYEKFDIVVVRKAAYDALTEGQRAALDDAAKAAGASALAERFAPSAILATWCSLPDASAVHASEADLEAIHERLDTVTNEIAQDADAAAALERMRDLGDGLSPDALSTCEPTVAAAFGIDPVGDQHVLDGTWRIEVEGENIADAGFTGQAVAANDGLWTFVFDNGIASVDQPHGSDCLAEFRFAGDRFSMNWELNSHCGGYGLGSYRIDGDTVHFTFDGEGPNMSPAFDNAFFVNGLVRVG